MVLAAVVVFVVVASCLLRLLVVVCCGFVWLMLFVFCVRSVLLALLMLFVVGGDG